MITIGLIVAFVCLQVCIVDCDCRNKDLEKLQSNCKRSGLNIDMAETIQNKTLVCDCLQEMFNCVNRTVPNCVASMKDKYIAFSYTPWDCHLLEHKIHGTDDKCRSDNLFEVKMKESSDDVDVITDESRNSCRICNLVSKLYFLVMVEVLHWWFNQI